MYKNNSTGDLVTWDTLNSDIYKDQSIPADGAPRIINFTFVPDIKQSEDKSLPVLPTSIAVASLYIYFSRRGESTRLLTEIKITLK